MRTLTRSEVACLLGITPSRVTHWVVRGYLQSVPIAAEESLARRGRPTGGDILVADLRKFLLRHGLIPGGIPRSLRLSPTRGRGRRRVELAEGQVTALEAAAICGMNVWAFRKACLDGQIPGHGPVGKGRVRVYVRSILEDFANPGRKRVGFRRGNVARSLATLGDLA